MNEDVRKYRKYGKSSDLLITKKKQGGGILLEQSHDLSSLLWIMMCLNGTNVQAQIFIL